MFFGLGFPCRANDAMICWKSVQFAFSIRLSFAPKGAKNISERMQQSESQVYGTICLLLASQASVHPHRSANLA